MKERKLLCKLFLHRWRMHPAKWLTVVVPTRICLPFEKNCCKIFEPLEDFSRWFGFISGFCAIRTYMNYKYYTGLIY